jgi:Holliday junction resolvase-like predicted endonuclease
VKSRAAGRFGSPFEAVTRTKQVRLRRLAAQWLRDNRAAIGPGRATVRFDVAAFVGGRLEVVQDAF